MIVDKVHHDYVTVVCLFCFMNSFNKNTFQFFVKLNKRKIKEKKRKMENPLCKYKEIGGKPGEGIHKYRLFNIAIVDVLMTILGGYLFAYIFHLSPIYSIIVFFVVGIIVHRMFCVRTTIDKLLFS